MNIKQFQPSKFQPFSLDDHKTKISADYSRKFKLKKELRRNVKRLEELQEVLYASDRYSILLIFQAMDAAGKDGTISHVMSGLNPQGCQVFSFKQPSKEELDHDYLWRCAKSVPERGRIGIFNRSYYEDVLIVRVHPEILASAKLPQEIYSDPDIWAKRYEQIRNFERHLTQNGTRILKFFLNVSKDEQKKRFLARLDTPEKNWKFSTSDVKERQFWDSYQEAYKDAIGATSTDDCPWYIIPADDKKFMRLAVSEVIAQTLESLNLKYPEPPNQEDLKAAREMLENEN